MEELMIEGLVTDLIVELVVIFASAASAAISYLIAKNRRNKKEIDELQTRVKSLEQRLLGLDTDDADDGFIIETNRNVQEISEKIDYISEKIDEDKAFRKQDEQRIARSLYLLADEVGNGQLKSKIRQTYWGEEYDWIWDEQERDNGSG